MEVAGRPASELLRQVEKLIDATSRSGGVFVLNSSAFALIAIATGDLDAHVDVADGDGPLGLYSYDVAAAYLVLLESGGVCTGPDGTPVEGLPLFVGRDRAARLRIVAARNETIHQYVCSLLQH
jgi:fructose-1,6-bisphosphatase/inositol monophosphatase family enzyme